MVLCINILQAYEEAKKRLQMEAEDREKIVPEVRKQSRRDYLKKRNEDKMEDLELEIQEEDYYFGEKKYLTFFVFLNIVDQHIPYPLQMIAWHAFLNAMV